VRNFKSEQLYARRFSSLFGQDVWHEGTCAESLAKGNLQLVGFVNGMILKVVPTHDLQTVMCKSRNDVDSRVNFSSSITYGAERARKDANHLPIEGTSSRMITSISSLNRQ
jgi:hypothetical protein